MVVRTRFDQGLTFRESAPGAGQPHSSNDESKPSQGEDEASACPEGLPGHEAARQHVQPLEDPHDTEQVEHNSDDYQGPGHLLPFKLVFGQSVARWLQKRP
jgi:hypothetical protein